MLEEKEVDEEIVQQLRRFIMKVSFAANGVHVKLDKELADLRKLIKEDAPHPNLQEQVDKVTSVLRDIDEELQEKIKKDFDAKRFSKLIGASELPAPLRKSIQSTFKKAGLITMRQLVEGLEEALSETDGADGKKSKLFGLFRRDKQTSDKQPSGGEAQEELGAPSDNTPIPTSILEIIRDLLDNLDLPERFESQIKSIRLLLEKSPLLAELPDLLERIARIIIEASSEDHIEFEAFLLDLNKRLNTVQSFIENSKTTAKQSRTAQQTLNEKLSEEFSELQTNAKNSHSIEKLREHIDARLTTVVSALDAFNRTQADCNEQTDKQIARLHEQLRDTENETQRLKQLLIEQRTKAQQDPLTMLPNRHLYMERLDQEYNRWRRYRGNLSLVLADIDHFKKVNDTYGHLVGDDVIRAVANWMREGLRESDFIARYGGEEFVFIMPETTMVDATKAVNKLRQQIQNSKLESRDPTVSVTVSFGVAEFSGEDTTIDVFTRADKALYRAKEKGRNMVCCEKK